MAVMLLVVAVVVLVVDSVALDDETVDPAVALGLVFRRRAVVADLLVVSFTYCFSLLSVPTTLPASARLGRLANLRPISARSGGDDDSLSCPSSCGETPSSFFTAVVVVVVVKS